MFKFKRMKLDKYLLSCIKIKSKQIRDFNGKPETLNTLEENTDHTLQIKLKQKTDKQKSRKPKPKQVQES